MQAKYFTLRAGPQARAVIADEGLGPDSIGSMIGASGGPKWLVLSALDRVLAGEFFKGRSQPLHTLGSSAGAWRHVAYGVADNVAALKRFEQSYVEQRYETKPTAAEVSQEGRNILSAVLGESGIAEVVNNPVWRTHLSTVRSRGLLTRDNKLALSAGLAATAIGNLSSRKRLRHFFERAVFSPGGGGFEFNDFPTHQIKLTEANLLDAVLASGSIPLVMEGVSEIQGAPPGMYRDGGFIDYHFDFKFQAPPGLVFYPHFYSHLSAGWFDKFSPWRKVPESQLSNVVMLSPSPKLIDLMPFQKIPDRDDFKRFDNDQRQANWRKVVEVGQLMADEFYEAWQAGRLPQLVQDY